MQRRTLLAAIGVAAGSPVLAAGRARPVAAPLLSTLRDFVVATARLPMEVLYVGWAEVEPRTPRAPYAWWPADRSLLNLTQFEPGADLSWLSRKGRIDLRTDVVATEKEMSGSTFRVDISWAERVQRDCRRRMRLVVRRPDPAEVARIRRKLNATD